MENYIYLDVFLNRKNQTVLANKLIGEIAKDKSNIHALTKTYSRICIIISNRIRSINPSFLEGFLKELVLDIAHKKITSRVIFECQGHYDITEDLEETVDRILREAGMI